MLSECTDYTATVFPTPVLMGSASPDQQEQSVQAELSLRGCSQYIALYPAVVWNPPATGNHRAECSVEALKTEGSQDIYPGGCLPAAPPSIRAGSNMPCGILWSGSEELP